MVSAIGRSTDASTATARADISGPMPASFRYNNPGAQYPSVEAASFGQTGYGIIGGGHKIARFPSPVNGAAANFDLLYRKYTGMTIGAAGTKWTGAHGFGIPGHDPDSTLTKQLLDDPATAVALLKAIAGRESGRGNNLTEEQWRQAHSMFKAGSADAYLNGLPAASEIHIPAGAKTGAGLLRRAREHIGEEYRNVQVPKDDAAWKGPWDCAEFVSWLVYQELGGLYGCDDNHVSPSKADAYTGAWKRDVEQLGIRVTVEEAAATVGGIVLRYPPAPGKMGHIALCDGKGGTVEAKGQRYGVIADTVHGRVWHTGILIPGISYDTPSALKVAPPQLVYEPNAPNMDKEVIVRIQRALATKGFNPGEVNGVYGPRTQAAVAAFQEAEGLVVDGSVGPETAEALDISLSPEKGQASGQVVSDTQANGIRATVARNPLLLLVLALTLLSKEKPMAIDSAKPSQATDLVTLLLPLLLQSALTGKQLDSSELLNVLVTGKPATPGPDAVAQPQVSPQPPPDIATLLIPFLYERITGKPLSGADDTRTTDQPQSPQQPAVSRPSVQLSVAGLGITTILQALGILGTPFGMGAQPTQTGTLATLVPILTGVFGATNGFGAILGAARALFGGIANASGKAKA
ncbi:peptidoglycan-binding domain-containing protein [Sinorhizobium sp. 22678]|uniref:peptidoglycan-binding domain-containing protein n=1 Tax=Sinorhizobium sp. 22678 TaxID=3453955 RepID=UPI003F87D4AB